MLILHGHPLSSFCQKVAMALYEAGTPFRSEMVDLRDAASRERFFALWPVGQMPVLRDEARDETVPESSVIIDYLATYYPGEVALVPTEPELAWRARAAERLFDLHVQVPMQKIINDRLRPEGANDAFGVGQARRQLATALDLTERRMADRTWALGETFSMADCAAAPALFYADKALPFEATHPQAWAYLTRLKARPSYARALKEAEPFFALMPS